MKSPRTVLLAAVVVVAMGGQLALAGTIKGTVTASKKKLLPHTIVYVDSIKGDFECPKEHVLMNQKNSVFVPHVLPVLAGTTVDFKNSDDVAHNVFTPDKNADKFNLGTWPSGEIRSHTFEKRCDKVCDAVMLCNVHPEMEAFVLIMENPYFAVANDSGYFEIPKVPAGGQTIRIWHPTMDAEAQQVNVADSGSVAIEFTLVGKKKK